MHESAARRCGLPVSVSLHVRSSIAFSELARRMTDWISAGRFVPTRLMDAKHLETAEGISQVAGFMMGSTRGEADDAIAGFRSGLDP
jgi:hypothetical protein